MRQVADIGDRSADPGAPERGRYQAWLFGPFRVRRNGMPIGEPAWPRASARSLLKWFLLNPGERVSSSELCELFWPGERGRDRTNRLRVTLHCLRRALEPEGTRGHPSTFVRSDRRGRYWFDPADLWWTDVAEVERLAATARAAAGKGDRPGAIAGYERLAGYYRRGFLPEDVYDDTFDVHRNAHERAHSGALHQLMELYLAVGFDYEALSCGLEILEIDQYSEAATIVVARIGWRHGDSAGAVRRLDEFTRTVEHDLGIVPGPGLLELRSSIGLPR